jgi:hypothetical protein
MLKYLKEKFLCKSPFSMISFKEYLIQTEKIKSVQAGAFCFGQSTLQVNDKQTVTLLLS